MEYDDLFGIGIVLVVIAVLIWYCLQCYGLQLLSRKFEPTIPPALSWIPLVQLYPFVKISGKSWWWILGYFVPILSIFTTFYIPYHTAKRAGYDVGMMIFLAFVPTLAYPWLGLNVYKKKTTPVWTAFIVSIVILLAGFVVAMIGAILSENLQSHMTENEQANEQIVDTEEGSYPLTAEEIAEGKEYLANSPELQSDLQATLNDPAFIEAMKDPKEFKTLEDLAQYDIQYKILLDAYNESIAD